MASDSKSNSFYLSLFERSLSLQGLMPRTKKTYLYLVAQYLENCGKNALDVTQVDLENYILELYSQGFMRASVRLQTTVLRLFFNNIMNKKFALEIPLPKKEKQIPKVLPKEDINKMISSTFNIKHKLILMVFYSSGIRLDELRRLKKMDFEFERSLIRINNGKGAKDRVTILSGNLKSLLKDFFKNNNSVYAFPGRRGMLSSKSIELIVDNASKRAKIGKTVTPHMLRHSFATHLLDAGVDIFHIKKLLGHAKIETTQVYLSVSNRDLSKIKSPLDFKD